MATFRQSLIIVAGVLAAIPGSVIAAERHSGTVVSVDAAARTVAIEELGVAGHPVQLAVRVPRDARVVTSERLPDADIQDPTRPFRDTPIALEAIRVGDFVTIESAPGGPVTRAGQVIVTRRGGSAPPR